MVTFKSLPDSANSRVKYGILTMGTATVTWWRKYILALDESTI